MRNFGLAVVFGFLSIGLAGCASNATRDGMTVSEAPAPANKKFAKVVEVQPVSGGQETNPLWTSQIPSDEFKTALEQSLKNAGYGAESGDAARYQLTANLKKLDQPFFGFNMTVTSVVQYVLTDKKTKKVVLNQEVTEPFTAGVGDAFFGVKRLRLANEGSAKKNIEQLIAILQSLNPDKVAIQVR